jgi:signal transduction histidine kinase
MNRFESVSISEDLIESLATALRQGHSASLLGGRYVGKRFVLRRLYQVLRAAGVEVGAAGLMSPSDDDDDSRAGPADFLSGIPCLPRSAAAILDWWRTHHDPAGARAACLLLANIDALPAAEEDALLGGLGEIGCGGVLITCEAKGAEWFRGESPRVRCDRNVVVTRFAPAEFDRFARRYLDRLPVHPLATDRLIADLYDRTGGNVFFLRVLLWAGFDRWAAEDCEHKAFLDLSRLSSQAVASMVPWNHYLRHVTRIIGGRPEVWPRLERLVRDGKTEADPAGPDLLELTGIPVREGDRLRLPRQVVAVFLQRHYTLLKFADLYAGRDDWDQAFARLAEVPEPHRARPALLDDVADVGHMIRRLGASLYRRAALGTQVTDAAAGPLAVRDQFEKGCRLLLGFPHVWFLQRPPRKNARWDVTGGPGPLPGWVEAALNAPVRAGESPNPDYYPLPGQNYRTSLVVPIAAAHPLCSAALVIHDPNDTRTLVNERMDVLQELTAAFVGAYGHALAVERLWRRADIRQKLGGVVNDILAELGVRTLTVAQALSRAADHLRAVTGYRRVLISLLDPDRKILRGCVEASDGPQSGLLRVIERLPLDRAQESLHAAVVASGGALRSSDYVEQWNNTILRDVTALQAATVVPLDTGRRHGDRPVLVGTLFVERPDDLPPDDEEFADLIQVGRKLAGVIEQAERNQLLQSALDKQREPLCIYDAGGRLRYANALAVERMGLPPLAEWTNPEAMPPLGWDEAEDGDSFPAQARQFARRAYQTQNRLAELVTVTPNPTAPPEVWAVLADVIQSDGPNPLLGVFVAGQDLSFVHCIFQAASQIMRSDVLSPDRLTTPSQAPSLTDRLVNAIGQIFVSVFGHEVVHLDVLDPSGRELVRLRRYDGTGQLTDLPEPARFAAAGRALACFDPVAPRVFYFDKERQYPDGAEGLTPNGLVATIAHDRTGGPDDPLPSRLWIDFPLLVGTRRYGKLVYACRRRLLPEELELLKLYLTLLCDLVRSTLDQAEQIGHASDLAARQTLQTFFHTLFGPLKGVPLDAAILADDRTPQSVRQRALARLMDAYRRFTHYAEVARGLATLTQIDRTKVDLPALVGETLMTALRPGNYELAVEGEPAPVAADRSALSVALQELIQNSYAHGDKFDLRVAVHLRYYKAVGGDRVEVEYSDNGPGIPEAGKHQIFEGRFADPWGGVSGGGIGLSFVARVVALHGGTINEVGRPGVGARFVIDLPRQ